MLVRHGIATHAVHSPPHNASTAVVLLQACAGGDYHRDINSKQCTASPRGWRQTSHSSTGCRSRRPGLAMPPWPFWGDFNPLLDNPPPPHTHIIVAAVLTHRPAATDKEVVAAIGGHCVHRFATWTNKRPTRIEGLPVSTRLDTMPRGTHTTNGLAIPGHVPVKFKLVVETQHMGRFIKPAPLELLGRGSDVPENLACRLLSPLEESLVVAIVATDVDVYWRLETWAVEEVLLDHPMPHVQPADIDGKSPL